MSPWVWLGIWIALVPFSIAVHETAHAVTAVKGFGWKYNGLMFKWYVLGIGVKLEADQDKPGHGRALAATAAMGPVGSLLLGLLFLLLANITLDPYAQSVFTSMYALNIVIAVVNLVPTPITDGGHILTGLFGWKMRWRYLIFVWLAVELIVTYLFFF